MSADVVSMANQIARNVAHTPDGANAVAAHIEAFWPQRMRDALLAAAADGAALEPAVEGAVRRLSR